jgi:hypothetical protein
MGIHILFKQAADGSVIWVILILCGCKNIDDLGFDLDMDIDNYDTRS